MDNTSETRVPSASEYMEWLTQRTKPIPVGGGTISPTDLLATHDDVLFDVVFRRWTARLKGDVPLGS